MGKKFITFSPKQAVLKMVCNLALFCLATVWATFQKIGQFFPNHPVTLLPLHLQANEFPSFGGKSEDICFQQKIF
jgi:hypothetical protein